jgi:NADPH:quinone reductase-like Zn-dependent oxidoreductase
MLPRIASARRLLSMHAAAGERMRAVQVTAKLGRLDDSCKGCFAIVDLPRPPPPAAGHVVVRVARAQINPSDTSFFKVDTPPLTSLLPRL